MPPKKKTAFDRLSEHAMLTIICHLDTGYDGLRKWVATFIDWFSTFASKDEDAGAMQDILVDMMDAVATDESWRIAYPKYKSAIVDYFRHHGTDPADAMSNLFAEGGPLHRIAEPDWKSTEIVPSDR
jgi:hypothetical protein